ncbi:MAG: glycosyltransferase [Candidatus Omnitrophica bacterium]|nr:glycosyltransferase [Candidatus Omnitrophota bacterium]
MPKGIILSIIIPVFNEEKVLGVTLNELNKFLSEHNSCIELIVVNDASQDMSLDLIRGGLSGYQCVKIINNDLRQGKALSICEGLKIAQGEYIIFMDSDLSVPIKEISKVFERIKKGSDIIIGVRDEKDKDTVIERPLYRKAISKIYNALCNVLFFKNKVMDVGCGFKAFRREIAQELLSDLYIRSWIFDIEVLSRAFKNNYKVEQVSVSWIYKGCSHLNIYKDLFLSFLELFKLKFFLLSNKKYRL